MWFQEESLRTIDSIQELLSEIFVSLYGKRRDQCFGRKVFVGILYVFALVSLRVNHQISSVLHPVFRNSIYSPRVSSQIGFGRSEIISTEANTCPERRKKRSADVRIFFIVFI